MREMYQWVDEGQNQRKPNSVTICVVVGSGLGLGLGIIFGFAFGNPSCVFVGVTCGALMGLAIGESIKEYKEYSSS